MSNSRARAEYDPARLGVKVHVARHIGRDGVTMIDFPDVTFIHTDGPSQESDANPLRLDEDDARAIYEALADYFGGTGHDTRALRRDYDAERGRVDKLIGHLTSTPTTVVVSPEPGAHVLKVKP